MRKEVVVAVAIGLILGLVITYGFYQARSTVETIGRVAQEDTLQSPPATTDPQLDALGTLTLASPENEIVTDNPQLTVAGTTTADSLVVVFLGEEPTVTTADASGSFSVTVELSEGSNVITVHAVDEDGQVTKQERVVVFTTEEFLPAAKQPVGDGDDRTDQSSAASFGFDFDVDVGSGRFIQLTTRLAQLTARPVYAQADDALTGQDALQEAAASLDATSAADASPSGKTQFDPAATKKLKERIERIVDEKKEQIKGVLSQIGVERRGFIGEVERISEETITVKTVQGLSIIPLTEAVTLEQNGRDVEVDDIEVGNWATVLGVTEQDTFQPLKVDISEDTLRPRPLVVVMGSVVEVSRTELVIVRRDNEDEISFELDRETVFQDLVGDEVDLSDVVADIQVLVAGLDDDGDKQAQVVRLLTTVDEQARP